MISKLHKGRGIRGVLNYLLAEADSAGVVRGYNAVIGGTIVGESVGEISRQYAKFRALKPDLKNVVVHNSWRLPADEKLSREQWREVGEKWAQAMGLELYTIVQHEDDHAHLAGLRIKLDGTVVSDSHDYARSERIIRQLEREYGLQQVEESHLLDQTRRASHRRAPTREQIGMHERTEKVAPSVVVQAAIDEVMAGGAISASQFVDEMERRGIDIRANVASTGKFNGFSYGLDGVKLTSSTLGQGYKLSSLQARGLSYEQSRDFERLRATLLSAEIRADADAELSARADRAVGSDVAGSDRAIGGGLGASGRGYDDAARPAIRDGAEDRKDHEPVSSRQRDDEEAHLESAGVGGRVERRPAERPSGGSRFAGTAEAVDLDHSSDAVRVLSAHTGVGLGVVQSAVTSALTALPDELYQVRLLRRDSGAVTTREWSGEQIMKAIPWLRRENARGKEILFRPTDSRYVLLDDVPPGSLPDLKAAGCAPALAIETSPGRIQAWMRLPHAVPDRELTEISRQLVQRFGADKGGIGAIRFGKLPGFTNRKPEREYEKGGKVLAPFVKIIEATGAILDAGADLIRYARASLVKATTVARVRDHAQTSVMPAADLAAAWSRAEAAERTRRLVRGLKANRSGIDFVAAAQLLRQGADPADLIEHLAALSDRHADPDDYARRTVEAAAKSNRKPDDGDAPEN